MKNNSFLNKKSNERFSFLDNQSIKSKESNKNSSLIKKYEPISRFKNSHPSKKPPVTKFVFCEQDFPSLNNNHIPTNNSSSNYKNSINFEESNNNFQQNTIPPGCIEITKINGQSCFKNGPLTPYQININNLKNYEEYLINDPNYIMNNAISYMKNNWEKFRLEYDSVYGEGAYENKFIYKNEYETDDESDTSSEIDNDFELELNDQYEKDYLV